MLFNQSLQPKTGDVCTSKTHKTSTGVFDRQESWAASSHLFQEQLLLGHPALMHKARHA
jgi:hypothetical protein